MADKRIFGNDGPSKPDLPKSTFDKSYTNNLSARFGRLYPVFCDMVPPNSTAHITPHMAFDMMPTVSPIQANIRSHLSIYKIPLRITWRNYKDFFSRVGDHQVPYIHRTGRWCETGSLADYMGIPTMVFREMSHHSPLNFLRRGFISRELMTNVDLKGLYFDSLFHQALVREDNLQGTVIGADMNVISSVVSSKLYDGLIVSDFVTATQSVMQSYNGLPPVRLLAVRLQPDKMGFQYVTPVQPNSPGYVDRNHATMRRGYVVHSFISGQLEKSGPGSGVAYPYDAVPGGSFNVATSSSDRSEVIDGITVYRHPVAFRLSDSFLTMLNEMVTDAQASNHLVVLLMAWQSDTKTVGVFGSNSSLENLAGVSVLNPNVYSFSEGILSGEKPNTTNLLSASANFVPSPGLSLEMSCNTSHVVNDQDSENPFVAPADGAPKLPVNAFAFRAYEFIYNFFFRNDRVDPFMKLNPDTGEMEPTYNQFLTNDGDGADSTTPVDFFTAPYEYDLFTTCQKTPQFGNAPLVGITTNDDGETAEILMRGQRLVDGQPEDFDYTIAVRLGDDNRIMQISNYDEIADQPSVMRLNEAIRYGISINDFRSVNAFQIMQERFLKAGYQYRDLVKEFFGTTPPIGEEFPEYLGGVTRDVTVRKIENVALSADAQLGEFAGTGQVAGHGERVECFCSEWSIIMGVMWFSVTPVYSQKIDKHFLYHKYFDFYNPALMSIGPQPVFNYQLAPLQLPRNADGTIDEEHLADVFGYNRPWSDMVSKQDEAHGEFRGSMHSYLLQRLFQSVPKLGHDFLHISPEDLTDIFSYVQDTDKFYGAIRFEYFCKMPLPKVSLPRII